VTGWLVQNMIGASAVMLAVLVLRTPAARAFGAGWAYALWLLPLVRLLLPPLPALAADLSLPSLAVIIPAAGGTAASLPPSGGPGQWVPVLLALWAGGAAAFLVYQFRAYRGFLAQLSLASRSAGAFRGLPVIESDAVDGPIAVGLLDRRIVVPADFANRYSAVERRLAAEHEYVHHRRGDIWWNLAALLVLALNWFNPVAWIAFVAFRADQELACDAAVAAGTSPSERHDYARALIKSASRPGLIAACPLNHADQLKRRLKMLKDHRTTRLRNLGGAAALVVLAGATLSLASPGAAHPHPEGDAQTKQQRIVIMDHRDGDAAAHGRDIMIRRGPNGEMQMPEGCTGSTPTADVSEGEGNRRTRIMICSRDGASPTDMAANLERARDRIAQNEELSAETRARLREQLDREIARLRAR
jgi:bla regulator protein BlaR1